MLDSKPLNKIVFLDIETSSQYATFAEMPERMQKLFKKRFKKEFDDIDLNAPSDAVATMQEYVYSTKAPLFAEFGRILCISCGLMNTDKMDYTLKVVTVSDKDEKTLLSKFLSGMTKYLEMPLAGPTYALCAHNGTIFDFPFIAKRIIINKLALPKMFDYVNKKPWDIEYLIDTKSVWKYNVFDHNTSLDLLCAIFDVGTSKDDIDGSQVKDIFWTENDLPRICTYCEKDVHALATCYLRIKGLQNNLILTK